MAIVWTTLYTLSGTASYLVWLQHANRKVDIFYAFVCYIFSLVLIGFWYPLFFGYRHLTTLAFIDSCLLAIVVLITTILFFRISKAAGFLMLPYSLYLFFSAYLNAHIVIYNGEYQHLFETINSTITTAINATNV